MPIRNFSDEYRQFVRGYVLPLLGVPKRNVKFYNAKDEYRCSDVVGKIDNTQLYFSSLERTKFYMDIGRDFTEDHLKLARMLCRSFFEVSRFQYKQPTKEQIHYASDLHRDRAYEMAVQRGICMWSVGKKCDSVEKLLSLLEKWAVQTYEGRKVTFGFVVNPKDTTSPSISGKDWLKFLENDYSAVLTDCIHSLIQLDKDCGFIQFLSLAEDGRIPEHELSPFLPVRFSQCIGKYIHGSAIGLFLLNNGDIVLSKDAEIKLVKRNLHWLNFSFRAFRDAICESQISWNERLLQEVYATTLDVSFAHTGGIIAIVESPDSLRVTESPILKPCDDLMRDDFNLERDSKTADSPNQKDKEMRAIKREVIKQLVGRKSFCQLDRKLRSELTAMDGACILDLNGNVISFGAIIRNEAESSGGARSAACKTLSKHGPAVKISTDGYVELYLNGSLTFSIK